MAVTVQGKVVGPDGVAARGYLEIRLAGAEYATTDDGGTQQTVFPRQWEKIASDGTVGFDLIPSSEILPAGTTWRVTYHLSDGDCWTEVWQVGTTDPVDIGDIPRA